MLLIRGEKLSLSCLTNAIFRKTPNVTPFPQLPPTLVSIRSPAVLGEGVGMGEGTEPRERVGLLCA